MHACMHVRYAMTMHKEANQIVQRLVQSWRTVVSLWPPEALLFLTRRPKTCMSRKCLSTPGQKTQAQDTKTCVVSIKDCAAHGLFPRAALRSDLGSTPVLLSELSAEACHKGRESHRRHHEGDCAAQCPAGRRAGTLPTCHGAVEPHALVRCLLGVHGLLD